MKNSERNGPETNGPERHGPETNGIGQDDGKGRGGGRPLVDLGRRLSEARESSRIVPKQRPGASMPPAGLGLAMRIGVEMVAGVGVGAAVGYGLDRWLGTSPWLMILMFFLGAAAGALNTYRAIVGAGFGGLLGDENSEEGPDEGDGPDT